MEPLGTELFNMSAASYERTFWVPGKGENGEETIVRDRRVQSFPETMDIEDGCKWSQVRLFRMCDPVIDYS
jgi:hypothetical protein